jgi:hypothetical protein
MAYTVLKNFERGIDARRLIDCTEPGALLDARDCHVTRGGELEKRAAFVENTTLPASTVGLYVREGPTGIELNTWGDAATAPAGMPSNGVYNSIPYPACGALIAILSVEEFLGKLYVVAQYADGHIVHWWQGIPVSDYVPIDSGDGGGTEPEPPPENSPNNKPQAQVTCAVQQHMVEGMPETWPVTLRYIWLLKPGTTYNFGTGGDAISCIATTTTDAEGRPVAATTLTPDTGAQLASLLASAINTFTSTPVEVSATAAGNKLTIWVDLQSTAYNGWSIALGLTKATATPNPAVLAGGVDTGGGTLLSNPMLHKLSAAPRTVAEGISLPGTSVIAHNSRMFSVNGSRLNFSMVEDPSRWDSLATEDEGGYIDMSTLTEAAPQMMSLADYESDLAIFCYRHIIIWHMDEETSYKRQILHRTGLIAPNARVAFGQNEVMYLDRSGVRSLRARSSINEAFASDIGDPIDELVKAKIDSHTQAERLAHYWAEVEPRSGRLWMALKDKIFVLSYYPGTNIAAWTWYDATTCPVDYMNAFGDWLYWRSGNRVMVYGGAGSAYQYDATEGLARMPYIDGGKPATQKNWSAIDTALFGTWSIKASFDPTQPTAFDLIANVTKSTYAQQKIAMNGQSPAVSLELRTTHVGPARIGNMAVHYDDAYAD